jgi:hypothetical protein
MFGRAKLASSSNSTMVATQMSNNVNKATTTETKDRQGRFQTFSSSIPLGILNNVNVLRNKSVPVMRADSLSCYSGCSEDDFSTISTSIPSDDGKENTDTTQLLYQMEGGLFGAGSDEVENLREYLKLQQQQQQQQQQQLIGSNTILTQQHHQQTQIEADKVGQPLRAGDANNNQESMNDAMQSMDVDEYLWSQ